MPNDLLTNDLSGSPKTELSSGAIEDLLSEDKSDEETRDEATGLGEKAPKPKKTEKTDKTEEEEEDTDKEDEVKLTEDDELNEDIDEDTEVDAPVLIHRKEILAKYPNIFKDFPQLEKSFYRERQYTEVFPTIDEAKEAYEKSQALDGFEKDILSGNTEKILKIVKDEDSNAFNKLVDNYLPNLAKVDRGAYLHVVGNVVKQMIFNMARQAKSSNNEALASAAQILNQFAFATDEFQPPSNLARPDSNNGEEDKLKKERAAFVNERLQVAAEDVRTRISNTVRSTITNHIDPKDEMDDYTRRNAIRDAMENLDSLLERDDQLRSTIDKLWKRAADEKFSQSSLNRIRSTFIAKVKLALPGVIKKSRNEALKGRSRRKVEGEEKDRRGPLPAGRSVTAPNTQKKNKGIPEGMTPMEYMMSDID